MDLNNIHYTDLNQYEKLALRNALLAEYLNAGNQVRACLEADLQVMLDDEEYEAAALYRDLLKDLDILDELSNREL